MVIDVSHSLYSLYQVIRMTTEYLTGKPRAFFEPELTILATKRIKACREVMAKIAITKDDEKRYVAAEEAVLWWQELLEEE